MSLVHDISHTYANEQGYKYINGSRISIHKDLEDVGWSGSSKNGSKIYILADGHGGAGAAQYFVHSISSAVLELMDSKNWDLKKVKDRTELIQELEEIFIRVDNDYTLLKYDEFIVWFMNKALKKKPDDDGCTFVLNILCNGFLINANIGDSRTILGVKNNEESSIKFSSVDHNTTNPDKILEIIRNGGNFVSQKGEIFNLSQNNLTKKTDYDQLCGARIYRSPSLLSVSVGLSHRRTLNLTGSMGDIHFKLEPPVLTSAPDISITELDSNLEYLLIAATDGVWDHLISAPNYERQNDIVKDLVFSILEGEHDDVVLPIPSVSEISIESCENLDNAVPAERLKYAADSLVKREDGYYSLDLFHESLPRYDDATAQIIHMVPSQQ